jgi:hypothetical protein
MVEAFAQTQLFQQRFGMARLSRLFSPRNSAGARRFPAHSGWDQHKGLKDKANVSARSAARASSSSCVQRLADQVDLAAAAVVQPG